MFTLMYTLITGAFICAVCMCYICAFYLIACYVFSRIGAKFGHNKGIGYFIPIYNIMLLCDCAGISRWLTLCLVAPGFVAFLFNVLTWGVFCPGYAGFYLADCVAIVSTVVLFGKIAERLGKNFWLWGIGTVLFFGLPVIFLAFDQSFPVK